MTISMTHTVCAHCLQLLPDRQSDYKHMWLVEHIIVLFSYLVILLLLTNYMTHTVPAVITSRQSDYEHMWLVERVMFKVEEMTKLMRIFLKVRSQKTNYLNEITLIDC